MSERASWTVTGWDSVAEAPFMEDAVCASGEYPPDLWFADGNHEREVQRHLVAVGLCHRCPALIPCRRWALAQGVNLYGIWGGLTAHQRMVIRRESLQETG